MLNEDYKEMLQILLGNETKFLVVGAYAQREEIEIEGISIPFISKENLIKNKLSTGRKKDRLDADYLQSSSDA